jgi:hypothetical protein
MEYQDYINLGFERIELDDNVEFKQTGYHGFMLEKILCDTTSIFVSSGSLENPKMYIYKNAEKDTCHILQLTPEMVKSLLAKRFATETTTNDYLFNAC